MLKNAITFVCLAGDPNRREREHILSKLDLFDAEHYIILFKTFGRMVKYSVIIFNRISKLFMVFQMEDILICYFHKVNVLNY